MRRDKPSPHGGDWIWEFSDLRSPSPVRGLGIADHSLSLSTTTVTLTFCFSIFTAGRSRPEDWGKSVNAGPRVWAAEIPACSAARATGN